MRDEHFNIYARPGGGPPPGPEGRCIAGFMLRCTQKRQTLPVLRQNDDGPGSAAAAAQAATSTSTISASAPAVISSAVSPVMVTPSRVPTATPLTVTVPVAATR